MNGANARGALFMVVSMFCFVANDAVMKTFADEMAWYQALAVRGVFTVALSLLFCAATDGLRPPRTVAGYLRDPATVVRVTAEIGSTAFFLLALFEMALANVTAITQVLPLLLTLGGALFFRERVGIRRWAASLVGFAGVMLIVQPGTEAFDWAAFYALASAVCMAARDLATKAVPACIPSSYLNLLTAAAVWIAAIGLTVPVGWPSLDPWTLLRLALSAAFITCGFITVILAMRVGEASFVAPFRYSILIWALLVGYLLFGEVPGPWKLVGAAVVVGAGLYTFARERRSASSSETASASAPVSSASHSRKR